jgi:hypothetical protein
MLTIAIFAMGTLAIAVPVSAHFTLGDLTGTYNYHTNDFDPHVPGVIGYVWPGGGLDTYSGSPASVTVNNAPGYQAPYPNGNPPGAPSTSWYQLEGDTYAPFGAILAGSTGDLIFAVNATACANQGGEPTSTTACTGTPAGTREPDMQWDYITIYIPPGFTVPDASQVVTSFTNDYSNTIVTAVSPSDRYAPGWTAVSIEADAGQSANSMTGASYYNHQRLSFTRLGEWYYIRINGVTAPMTAGRYFFKILMGNSATLFLGGNEGTNQAGAAGMNPTQFIPTENWPVLLVKGEIDPAILTGTVRYAGYNATLYGQPIGEAGMVKAVMTMRLDPYTGQQRPDLPLVNAVGYFNATANGHFEVEGLAPGIYDLYASAAGFPQTLVQSGFTVLKGQSLHFDVYLQPGPVIHGNVFTKHQFGDEPWPANAYIKIELYNSKTFNNVPDSNATMVSWSPLPCVAGGQELFFPKRDAGYCNDPRLGSNIAFPWHEYTPANGYGVPTATTPSYYQVAAGGALGSGQFSTNNMQDPMGVGPPQHWFVQGQTTTPFHFEFGVKGEYGAPTQLDGMVPQVYATWVNGLTAGRYYVRAWTFRYVQTALDGSTFQEYYFDITPNEWAGDVTLPLDLRLSSWINKTVYFHDVVNGITTDPIDTGAGVMSGVLVDANSQVWSYNQTLLGYEGLYSSGYESGYQAAAFSSASTLRHENDLDKAKLNQFAIETGKANIQFAGWNDTWGGENYGIPSGTYQPHVFALGYIELAPVEWVSVTLSGNPTSISDHVYRGAGFNVTVYSIDWERPRVSRNWVWGQWGAGINGLANGDTAGGGCWTTNIAYPTVDAICNGQGATSLTGTLYPYGAGFTTAGPTVGNPATLPGHTTNFAGVGTGPWNVLNSMVGQEIDIGIYNNGTLVDFVGDETSLLADTTTSSCLFQNDTASAVQMCGGGWDPYHPGPGQAANAAGIGYILYDGNTNDAFFGQELKRLGFVGGYTSGSFQMLTAKTLFAPAHFSPSTLTIQAGQAGGHSMDEMYNSAVAGFISLYPSALPVGQQYDLRAYTYGYVQDKDFSAFASQGQVSDMKINLIIGVNVSLQILFKRENIITPTAENMSARVRLFDDSGNLVAEWMSSEGTYTAPGSGFARAADGTTQYPFGALGDTGQFGLPAPPVIATGVGGNIPWPNQLNAYNYLPGGTTLLTLLMAGLPQVPAAGQNDGTDAFFLPKGTYFMDPVLAAGCDFELDCYNNPGPNWNAPGYFPNTGILGAPDYQGGWSAEVDFVPLYLNNTGTQELLSGGFQQPSTGFTGSFTTATTGVFAQYYPPVSGLLMGESYHIIPGTTATSGVSLTDDIAQGVGAGSGWPAAGWSPGHTMAANHLGPYSQRGTWAISGTHNSGEASAIFEVDLNGFVTGDVLAFTWSNEFRPLSWGAITVTGAGLPSSGLSLYTFDGEYQAYLPTPGIAGSSAFTFTLNAPGYAPYSWTSQVPVGSTGTGVNVYLEQSNIPVPEFNAAPLAIIAFAALAASLYILRRRRN